jgi:hypothetical protein
MSTTRRLPVKALTCIFQQLPSKRDVEQCMLVRKTWYTPAAQEFQRKVTVSNHNYLVLRKNTLGEKCLIGTQWVKEISFPWNQSNNQVLEPERFASLLSKLTKLKIIKVAYHEAYRNVVKVLLSTAVDNTDGLNHVEDIILDGVVTKYIMRYYFLWYYKLRSSITGLSKIYTQHKYTINGGGSGNFLSYLFDLKNLTSLYINHESKDKGKLLDHDLMIFSVFSRCLNLVGFMFKSPFHVTESTVEGSCKTCGESGFI